MSMCLKWATALGSAMLFIGGACLGNAGCSPTIDQDTKNVVHSASQKSAMLNCEEIEERFGNKIADVLTSDILIADLQNMLDDPEFHRLLEEENPSEESIREELRCSLLTAAWNIGVQANYGHFLDMLPTAKRATVEERLYFYYLEQSIDASALGNSIHGGTLDEELYKVQALLEDYLSPEELKSLTAGSIQQMREIEGARRFMDGLFQGEELNEQDAEAIAIAFGREQGRAYEALLADPEHTNLGEELAAANERAMAVLSETLSPEAMVYAERLYEFYMMARE